ncbi:type IV secretory system conjugative DNA transfer family protein [Salinimicrobium sp. CAU 1759]|jgi:type IV secretory pathway TraG/TraD family ATPase VirD4
MIQQELFIIFIQLIFSGFLFWFFLKISSCGYFLNLCLIILSALIFSDPIQDSRSIISFVLWIVLPQLSLNSVLFVFVTRSSPTDIPRKYKIKFPLERGKLTIENVRRGVSIIGAAGSGKTESVVYNFLQHFSKYSFCGIIHDYKSFELTEIAYPLFKKGDIPFYIVSFDQIYHRVNPIAPRYLPDEESVNEVSRVLLENLLEQKDSISSGTTKFFNDAVEGLIAGLIWKLKTSYPEYCTLPHLIALYQFLNTASLLTFLNSNLTSKAMADAFISGIESERQTAAVKSTLANAFKKISTQRIFMTLSADEVPLDINNPQNPAVVSIVNNPKFETAYSPAIATIIHTIVKQMSVRKRESSFILLEEAPTIRLLNMHRIPATLRSYDIASVYVMQDKIQNELLYGEKASRAILSNLSYQFFGKVNDPDTAKYYERFFEIVKRQSISTSQSENLDFDTRITKSEREVSKIRADVFFRLQPGEFITFADGKDQAVKFSLEKMEKRKPTRFLGYSQNDIQENFERIHFEVRSIFALQ